jgi:hypothetical protein
MIEEEEDEEVSKYRDSPKLNSSSPHIMESTSDEDDQSLTDRPTQTSGRKPTKRQTHVCPSIINTENQYRIPVIPPIDEVYTLTMHSKTMKFRSLLQRQEVALAMMDTHLQESDKILPDLRKKWVEHSTDILQGALPGLPPL